MNDAERADWLARAIDSLLHGAGQDESPETLDDEELTSLLRVAEMRAGAGCEKRRSSADHEAAVWKQLTQRLETARAQLPLPGAGHAEEVVEAIATRRPLYEDEVGSATAGPEVWERVRQRLEAQEVAPPTPVFEGPLFASGDPQLDSLVRVALARPKSRPVKRDSHVQERLWARMRGDPRRTTMADLFAGQHEPSFLSQVTPKLLGAAAALALLVAAIGPLPVTGFADHPAVKATRSVGERVGLVTDAPGPPISAQNISVTGVEVTPEQARALLGLPSVAPAGLPDGFQPVSSRYYPAAITAREGGVYAAVYSTATGASAFNIYQEAASDTDFVGRGSPVDTQVLHTPATYFEGGWQSMAGGIAWDMTDSQTLVFQRNGLRTIIYYTGQRIAPRALLDIANAMAMQSD